MCCLGGHTVVICLLGENETFYLALAAKLAQKMGGECIPTVFPARRHDAALEWRCQKNHRWFAAYAAVYFK